MPNDVTKKVLSLFFAASKIIFRLFKPAAAEVTTTTLCKGLSFSSLCVHTIAK
jgi:hypothetical protein